MAKTKQKKTKVKRVAKRVAKKAAIVATAMLPFVAWLVPSPLVALRKR